MSLPALYATDEFLLAARQQRVAVLQLNEEGIHDVLAWTQEPRAYNLGALLLRTGTPWANQNPAYNLLGSTDLEPQERLAEKDILARAEAENHIALTLCRAQPDEEQLAEDFYRQADKWTDRRSLVKNTDDWFGTATGIGFGLFADVVPLMEHGVTDKVVALAVNTVIGRYALSPLFRIGRANYNLPAVKDLRPISVVRAENSTAE
jgi:hypothetical protein